MGVPKETSPEEMAEACLYQLELLLAQQTAPRDTAAIIIEPVLYVKFLTDLVRGINLYSCQTGCL